MTISNFQTTGITNGQNLTGETDYINIVYDYTNGIPDKLVTIWMSGGSTIRGISSSNDPNSILVPRGNTLGSDRWMRIYILDSNGVSSNVLSYDTIKFNVV